MRKHITSRIALHSSSCEQSNIARACACIMSLKYTRVCEFGGVERSDRLERWSGLLEWNTGMER